MPIVGLVLLVLWVVLVAGARSYLHLRHGRDVPLRVADPRGSAQWWSRRISSLGFLLAVAAPVVDLAGFPRIAPLDQSAIAGFGIALVAIGIALTLFAQATMGASWRADVDEEARTALVTTGPFRVVRNPTLSGTLITTAGLALITPNVLSTGMLVAFLVALEIQVRFVEEPYLARVHGDAYRRYAASTGRFVPGIGRLPRR